MCAESSHPDVTWCGPTLASAAGQNIDVQHAALYVHLRHMRLYSTGKVQHKAAANSWHCSWGFPWAMHRRGRALKRHRAALKVSPVPNIDTHDTRSSIGEVLISSGLSHQGARQCSSNSNIRRSSSSVHLKAGDNDMVQLAYKARQWTRLPHQYLSIAGQGHGCQHARA